jgi:uncharacterized phage infection (PIP) family protein YhgE
MSITFGILAALISAIAIWVGYLNSQAKDQQGELLKKDKAKHESAEKKLASLKKQIKDQNDGFNGVIANLAEKFDARDKKDEEIASLKQNLASLQSEVKELEGRLAEYQAKVPDIGEVDRLIKNLKEAKEAIAQIEASIEEIKGENERLTVEITQQEETIAYKKKWMTNHAEFQAQEELVTTVKAVYKNWGFVVLANGDVQGVTPRSSLVVKRGDEVIGELQVKTATNSVATAEIIFSSIKADDFIQVGDKVFPKVKPKLPEAKPATEEEPARKAEPKKDDPFANPF